MTISERSIKRLGEILTGDTPVPPAQPNAMAKTACAHLALANTGRKAKIDIPKRK